MANEVELRLTALGEEHLVRRGDPDLAAVDLKELLLAGANADDATDRLRGDSSCAVRHLRRAVQSERSSHAPFDSRDRSHSRATVASSTISPCFGSHWTSSAGRPAGGWNGNSGTALARRVYDQLAEPRARAA